MSHWTKLSIQYANQKRMTYFKFIQQFLKESVTLTTVFGNKLKKHINIKTMTRTRKKTN